MSAKLTDLLIDFVASSQLVDPELVQVWDEQGELDAEQMPFSIAEGETVYISNDFALTVFIESMPVSEIDMLKIIIGQFVKHYGAGETIDFDFPRLNKTECQAMLDFSLTEKMAMTKTGGVLSLDYCNPPIESL